MGPRDGGKRFYFVSFRNSLRLHVVDSLGGELYWAAGLSLITDFPKKPLWPVKTHLFLNAGRLGNIDKGELTPATAVFSLSLVVTNRPPHQPNRLLRTFKSPFPGHQYLPDWE